MRDSIYHLAALQVHWRDQTSFRVDAGACTYKVPRAVAEHVVSGRYRLLARCILAPHSFQCPTMTKTMVIVMNFIICSSDNSALPSRFAEPVTRAHECCSAKQFQNVCPNSLRAVLEARNAKLDHLPKCGDTLGAQPEISRWLSLVLHGRRIIVTNSNGSSRTGCSIRDQQVAVSRFDWASNSYE